MSSASKVFQEELKGTQLFQVQIDENAIQQVFQKLVAQIRIQNQEIEAIKKELSERPKLDEFEQLKNTVDKLKDETKSSKNLIQDNTEMVKSILDERNRGIDEAVQTKLNEMLFAVNAAIHKEIDELFKSEGSQKSATDEIRTMKLTLSKLTQKVDDVKGTLLQAAAAYDGKLNIEQLSRKTIPTCIRIAANNDRKLIQENKMELERIRNDFDDFSNTFNRILPYGDSEFPQFINGYIFSRDDAPTFPTAPYVHSFNDFAQYIAHVVPMMQSMIREIHANLKEIEQSNNEKLSQRQFNVFKTDLDKTLDIMQAETDDYAKRKTNFVLKDNFNELSDSLFDIINGAGGSSCTNTRCIACGSIVQRTTGSIPVTKDNQPYTSRSCVTPRGDSCMSARTTDYLRTDGLEPDRLFKKSKGSSKSQLSKVTYRKI